jgi:hypothetical protein
LALREWSLRRRPSANRQETEPKGILSGLNGEIDGSTWEEHLKQGIVTDPRRKREI